MSYLTFADASTQIEILKECAARNGLKGANGEPLEFKMKRMVEDKRVKAAFAVVPVEYVERKNLMSGNSFWIDRDTPVYLDPSRESYWSM